jgi:hypothetical protein
VADKAEGVLVLEEAVLIRLPLKYAREAIDIVPTACRVGQRLAQRLVLGPAGVLDLRNPAVSWR